jgi:hypothetical protein
MQVGLTDADPVAELLQITLLRAAGTTRRLALALSLTDTVHDLARGAIARTLPVADQTQVYAAIFLMTSSITSLK